jgi:hypothetical protein
VLASLAPGPEIKFSVKIFIDPSEDRTAFGANSIVEHFIISSGMLENTAASAIMNLSAPKASQSTFDPDTI